MPKLTDAELARQWAIDVLNAASKSPDLSGSMANFAIATAKNSIVLIIETFVGTVEGKKVS